MAFNARNAALGSLIGSSIGFGFGLAGNALGGAVSLVDYALGRPMNLWGKEIDIAQAPALRLSTGIANRRNPNILPPPDALIEAYRRGMISLDDVAWGLHSQGVAWYQQLGRPQGISQRQWDYNRRLWEQIGKMRRSRPDPASWAQLNLRGRITDAQYNAVKDGYDADWSQFYTILQAQYSVPGAGELLQLRRLGKLSEADYRKGMQALGWYENTWRERAESVTPLPGLYELMRLSFLGNLRPDEYAKYTTALGHTDDRARHLVEASYYQIPSGPELVNLAVRDAWNEDVVRRWGYDDEFPEPMRFWMKVQGWDWGKAFTGPDGTRYPSIHWPKLLWRAHWQVLPPGLAYQMYRRLRPERIGRYLAQFPNLTSFSLDDLRTVLKVHDYPTKAREWLAAINSQPLRMYTIRTAYRLKTRDRNWAMEQLRDSGYIDEDATTILDSIDAAEDQRDNAWRERMIAGINRSTVKEIIAGYGAGFVPTNTAIARLGELGFIPDQSRKFLALEDSRQLRETLREYLRAVRRDYLAGTMTDAELSTRLQQARIAEPAAQRYVARWTGQRGLERRSMSSGQVAQQVATGALLPAEGIARLLNLGWIQPDAQLLVQQAQARWLQAQARAAAQVARQSKADQKALLAAQASAARAVAQSQSRLRRITPLSVLKRWYCLGIRRSDWILARLQSQGYDTTSSADYLREWAMECEQGPLAEAPAVHTKEKLVARQTPRSVLKSWWQNGIASDQWIRQRLSLLGYTAQSIDGYIGEWGATLGKKPGPRQSGAPAQAPP